MFDVIIESKHIELTELQLRFLSKNSKFINKFIILINSNDALIDFKLKLRTQWLSEECDAGGHREYSAQD